MLNPSRLQLGGRADLGDFGLAIDGEYLLNSQNDAYPLRGTSPTGERAEVPNIYDWRNEVTLRAGLEYRLLPAADGAKRLSLRAGYVFDGKTTNEQYPSAFGTPPGPTHVLTAGGGWRFSRWQLNVAYAHRFGEGDVTAEDLMAPGRRACAFCGAAGDEPYRMRIHGLYVDASIALD